MATAVETSIWDGLPRLYDELEDFGKSFLWKNLNEHGRATSSCEVRITEDLEGKTLYSAHVVLGAYGGLCTKAGVRDAVLAAMSLALDMANAAAQRRVDAAIKRHAPLLERLADA